MNETSPHLAGTIRSLEGSSVTAKQLALLIQDALECGDDAYIEALVLSALEDPDETDEPDVAGRRETEERAS